MMLVSAVSPVWETMYVTVLFEPVASAALMVKRLSATLTAKEPVMPLSGVTIIDLVPTGTSVRMTLSGPPHVVESRMLLFSSLTATIGKG